MIWGCWGSFQTFSAVSGRRGVGCDFFSTASVWADHVRSSVMWTLRNLKLFTRSTGVLSMVMGVLCSVSWNPPPAPWSCRCWVRGGSPDTISQGTHLRSVGRLIVVSDQAYHRCVVSEFDDDVGAVCGCTVMCVQGVNLIKLGFLLIFTFIPK